MEGPSISLEPSNLTVIRGQLIHFRCLISSRSVPTVQWFKEREEQDVTRPPNFDGAMTLDEPGALQQVG